MIDELNNKYSDLKNVIDILPTNTKYNRKRKIDYILDEEKKDNERINFVKKEIESRINVFEELKPNDKINKIEKEIEKCNIINEWNEFNSAYEKMHLDYYLYQLHRYYKENLESVNICIKKIIESFKKVNITINKEDFNFNKYALLYMDKIINNASFEELKTCFEEIYWKEPDIIKVIEINFKSIYLKNEKKIDKYYKTRHDEFLKNHKDNEIYDMKIKLTNQLNLLKGKDEYLNFQKFINNEYTISEYNDINISKIKEKYFNENSYNIANLIELYNVLQEYKVLIDFKYLLVDMKDKLEKKDTLKDNKSSALKEIIKEESKLKKINKKEKSKGLFSKKNNEKWIFEYRESINNIMTNYNNFNDACFNDLVFTKLSQDSTTLDIFKLICSNYLYFVKKTYELDENQDINDITNKYNQLKEYINNNNFIILNNIALLDEKQMKQLIVDKYNLGHISITLDNLIDSNINNTIEDFTKLINYENIISSGINIDNVSLYLEYKKMIKN